MLISYIRLDHTLYCTYLNEWITTDIILLLYALNLHTHSKRLSQLFQSGTQPLTLQFCLVRVVSLFVDIVKRRRGGRLRISTGSWQGPSWGISLGSRLRKNRYIHVQARGGSGVEFSVGEGASETPPLRLLMEISTCTQHYFCQILILIIIILIIYTTKSPRIEIYCSVLYNQRC